MRVHQFKALVFWCRNAKKALAFPKNSFSLSSWRTRRRKAVISASISRGSQVPLFSGLAPLALEFDPPAHHRFPQP